MEFHQTKDKANLIENQKDESTSQPTTNDELANNQNDNSNKNILNINRFIFISKTFRFWFMHKKN